MGINDDENIIPITNPANQVSVFMAPLLMVPNYRTSTSSAITPPNLTDFEGTALERQYYHLMRQKHGIHWQTSCTFA